MPPPPLQLGTTGHLDPGIQASAKLGSISQREGRREVKAMMKK
jgi:hypothetical protein